MYYSGQGVLKVADRNENGTPGAFRSLGNVPTLTIAIDTTKFEHTESMSGNRATDLTLIQEKKGSFKFTMEDVVPANLALAFWGQTTVVAAATAHEEDKPAYIGYMGALSMPNVTNVVVKDEATGAVTYEFGTSPTAAESLNGWIDEPNGTYYVFDTATQTANGAAANIADLDLLTFTYDTGATERIDAFTETSSVKYLRFEGLNTVPDTNQNVIVEIFKGDLDPLNEYGLINEELASIEVSGSILYDTLQPGPTKYFRQTNVSTA